MKTGFILTGLLLIAAASAGNYPIVGSGVTSFYSDNAEISEPQAGAPFYGQDAHYTGNLPSYTDNGDGTVTDNVTGLMWQQDMGEKITWNDAFIKADTLSLAGYHDWRFPTIKELYSLIQFTGSVKGQTALEYFIDTTYFDHPLGDTNAGEREIDAQTWGATKYVGLTMNKDSTIFGVNFIDGRIKGYPQYHPMTKSANKMYTRMVRNNSAYGTNSFVDNGDGTVTDLATGLMWQTADDGTPRDWEEALSYCENLSLAGHDDWHLPTIKELQSLVDYTRSPQTTASPAIDPIFSCTEISDPDGNSNYGFYWSGTTHLDGMVPEKGACYIAFGEAQGEMNGNLMDVHGAGAQRSDPKSGDQADYPQFWGPQGDVRYVYNFVRAVRYVTENVSVSPSTKKNSGTSTSIVNSRNRLTLNLTLRQSESVGVKLFSMNGRQISEQSAGKLHKGVNDIALNSTTLSSGIYLMQVEGESFSRVQPIVIQ